MTRGLAVAIQSIGKSFGARPILNGVTIDIRPGEFVALVGQSGSGKSTLLRLVAGFDRPSAGHILFDGATTTRPADIRLMFQDARLLPWQRVIDNVGLGMTGDWRPRALDALRQVGLEERAGDWPSVLSGGQKQRVALARALVSRPRLLLLDEPLGALDALTRLEMQGLIEAMWRDAGFTAVLVTHDVAEAAALADRVIVLDEGRVGQVWDVPLARPRRRSSPELAAIEADILDYLMQRPVAA